LDDGELTNSSYYGWIAQHRRPRHTRCDLFEQLQPFRAQTVFEHDKAGGVAAGLSQAFYKPRADGVGHAHEYDRHGSGCLQYSCSRAPARYNDVWCKRGQFGRCASNGASIASTPASVDLQVTALDPAETLQSLPKRCEPGLSLGIVGGGGGEPADAPHPARLLRARRERPRRRCAAEKRDERAPVHSITSSASARSLGESSMPSAFAALRLTTSSNLVGCCTGSSAGLAPLSTLPAMTPAWRTMSAMLVP